MKSHFIFIFFFLCSSAAETTEPTLNDDLLGLIVFKSDLHDPQSNLASWNEEDVDPCGWTGVKCDLRTRRVAELSLDGFGLSGKIGRGLLQLSSLQKLSLSRNNFTGFVNPDLTRLEQLHTVDLSYNALSGPIPGNFFWQCRSLRSLSLAVNRLSGEIPESVGDCWTLASLNLSHNLISGGLPGEIWSLYGLRVIDLSGNLLVGNIPNGIGRMFNLRTVSLRWNRFSGILPSDIGECLLLRSIDLEGNMLSGVLPETMRSLSMCNYLNLASNQFLGDLPVWIGNMKSLQSLDLSNNAFTGQIPDSIGSLQLLKSLNFSKNSLTGGLPESMSSCRNLVELDFSRNSLAGNLPSWLFQLGLEKILLSGNNLEGSVRISTYSEQTLQILDLSSNKFSGLITVEIGELLRLKLLNLSHNLFVGSIPDIFGGLKVLEIVDLSANQINGSIPKEIGAAVSLKDLKLKNNSLSGGIPIQIGNCSSLMFLTLSYNNLSGPIPPTLAKLTNIQFIDFSHNTLTGKLPKELSSLPHLLSLNISHNFFSGQIPSGLLNKISPLSISDNPDLCGSPLNRSCIKILPKPIVLNPNSSSSHTTNSNFSSQNLRHKKIILSISALIAIAAAVLIALGVITITLLNLRFRSPSSHSPPNLTNFSDHYFTQSPSTDANSGKLVMFGGDDHDFSTGAQAILNKDCELGRGGFGIVYKTILRDGRPVAIKKLTVSSLVKSQEDFEKEIKKIGKMKHPNLVTLEGYYWTKTLQLLIYEFVSCGTLFKHLHDSPELNCLSWQERFDIILGVARSLAHLHRHGIIHYNLKSNNVLIDGAGEPKIADYGLAKLLPMLDRYILSSKIQSALGYMAPEFACRAVKITEKCDVYGYGVLVLEIVTGRKPVEYMEDDVVVLCDVVRGALDQGRVEECLDGKLGGKFPVEEAVPVVKLGLICTSQVPSNRPDMNEVVKILELIRCPRNSQEGELC